MKASGILISKELVLTCAHNFYTPYDLSLVNLNIVEIYIAPSGRLGDPYQVEKIYIPKEYQDKDKKRNKLFDYALVKLTKQTNLDDFIPLRSDFLDKIIT